MEEQNTTYIATYIFPQMDSEELSGAHAQLVKTLEDNGAHVLQSRMPSLRQFAYPIQRKTSGFMGDVEFWTNPGSVSAMSEGLRNTSALVRFMITKKERPEKKANKRSAAYRSAQKEEVEITRDKEKMGIEDIDKRLEEIMDNIGDS